jgi:hypothetical protein
MRESWVIAIASVVALTFMASLAWWQRHRILSGENDFVQLYTAARLSGTLALYDAEAVRQEQLEFLGGTAEAWRYTRLPYYAALLRPLGQLTYPQAYLLWQVLSLAALAGFVLLWQPTPVRITFLFTCFSLPAAVTWMNGQDLTFVLLALAASVLWRRQGRPFTAGLIFSLCAAKFHLFVLTPLLLLSPKNRRWGAGAAAGGLALLLLSFAVGGLGWPAAYLRVLTDPAIHPGITQMPNLNGLLGRWGAPASVEWLLMAVVAALVAFIARRAPFEYALAAALTGGLLLSYHAYLADCALLLPAALIVLAQTASPALRLLAVVLLTPVTGFLLLMNTPEGGTVMPLAMLALVGLMGVEVWRLPNQPSP